MHKKRKKLLSEKNKKILFLSPTGSGKTTLMHLLSGCNMIADIRGTLEAALFCNGQWKVHDMKIGHSNHAETYFPAIYE